MPWRHLWRVTTLLLAIALVLSFAFAATGSIEFEDAAAAGGWTAVCRGRLPRHDRELLRRCARVHGRVVAIRRSGRPGERETHLLVVARLHLFVVKLLPAAQPPRAGATATAVGPLVRARNGMREVEAWSLVRP